MPLRFTPVYCLLALLLCASAAVAAPRIVTSIEPLSDLASALTAGAGEAENLVPLGASPHHFAFRPSHLVKLREADMVIWIDRRFEGGFARVDGLLPGAATRLELGPALGLDGEDLHLWYSPRLLRASARLILEALLRLDPRQGELYRHNYARLETAIDAREKALRARLQVSAPLLLITDHAFLEAFAADFDRVDIHSLQDRHEGGGSLGDLNRLERLLGSRPAACLLTNEALPSALGAELARKQGLAVVSLLPAGKADASAQPLRHFDQLLRALERCGLQN